MATTSQTIENGNDRRIDPNCLGRALTADAIIHKQGSYQYLLRRNGHNEQLVDVIRGACDCADAYFREVACTHLLSACLHHVHESAQNTRLVAHVLRQVITVDCPNDIEGYAGPTRIHLRGYPCPGCVETTACDDWTVWTVLCGRTTG